MNIDNKKKLYTYEYNLIDINWDEIIDSGYGEVVAEDAKEAVDVAFSFIQLKYYRQYEYPRDIYIDIYRLERTDN